MSDRKPYISVIVPVYNVKLYVKQCFDSLCKQTLQEIEVILIDDGSKDGSGSICDTYAKSDPRFRVIHQQNRGLSAARNVGLDMASGEYVMFVDSDDWVEPEFCELPYLKAKETGAELVVFLRTWNAMDKSEKLQPAFREEGMVSKKTALTDQWMTTGVVVWNKLYHRKLFDRIRFPEGRLSEDTAVTHRLIHSADQVYALNKYLYHHRVSRPGSIMAEKNSQMRKDEQCFNLKRVSDLCNWGYIGKEDEAGQALMYLSVMGRDAELSKECEEILKQSVTVSGSRKMRMLRRVYGISPDLFDLICRWTGKRVNDG